MHETGQLLMQPESSFVQASPKAPLYSRLTWRRELDEVQENVRSLK